MWNEFDTTESKLNDLNERLSYIEALHIKINCPGKELDLDELVYKVESLKLRANAVSKSMKSCLNILKSMELENQGLNNYVSNLSKETLSLQENVNNLRLTKKKQLKKYDEYT